MRKAKDYSNKKAITGADQHHIRREYATNPIVKQWNDEYEMLKYRQAQMLIKAGVYKPGSENYPMPEPDTHAIARKIADYFTPIRAKAYEKLETDTELVAYVYG